MAGSFGHGGGSAGTRNADAPTHDDWVTSGVSFTIPTNARLLTAIAIGAGGAGAKGGGGGGGTAEGTYTVLAAEWGTSLTIAIGVGALATAGTATTMDGTLNGAPITQLKGFGGAKSVVGTGGAGGIASGGTSNISGSDGTEWDNGSVYGSGGLPGAAISLNTQIQSFYGQGGYGDAASPIAGFGGLLLLRWTF